ncbi:BTAD domain-containing putative transcriptional regulator [Streptomyces ipomoeae]|uniref:AfsR/SARP family transcriptional regulator n=2 Tax=Streptomyces ipomoeae TaxID=103232 RepID=UPI0029BB89B0|nr:BTAD domain-containing putative transcriptional regulator [Streptomyces ipomoeae]MDX2826728.1 BTAD domain-containing putative transcriptional regulator [Streptomyces ipomoeae]
MRFAVLGSLTTVDDDGVTVVVGGPKPRALLAVLLLEPNRTVPLDTVRAALWGEDPPPTATASLHNHVARLRRSLRDADGIRLRTMTHGLQLRVDEGELDRDVFEGQVRRAQEARNRGDWEAAERDADAALALWRGAPFADVPALAGHPVVTLLQEQRLQALECRFEALLHLDRLDGLAAELGSLVKEHPFRETLHRQLMLVLGRTDRQAEALALFRSLRRPLVEELGVEPGPAVQEAHREVLRSAAVRHREPPTPAAPFADPVADPWTLPAGEPPRPAQRLSAGTPPRPAQRLSAGTPPRPAQRLSAGTPPRPAQHPSAGTPPRPAQHPSAGTPARPAQHPSSGTPPRPARHLSAATPPRLAQLPAPPGGFVGRAEHIAEIRCELEADRSRTALAVISGMPGVGKTGLALHIAEQLRHAFPDGQLYLNLHGATPGVAPLAPADALAVLLHGLGVDARRIPSDVAAGSALLRSTLAPTRTLLVLDDAASVSQVRPLLPAGAGCAVLLTSRQPLATLGASTHVRLDPLSPQDSALLLERASGRSWAATDAEAVARLVALCGHLPLALRVCAARLRSRRTLPVEKLAERLARQEDRLDHLELEDLSVRRSLMAAHEALLGSGDPRDGDAATALVLIGALDLPEYGAPLMATAMDSTERSAEQALDRLVEVALLQEAGWGRYVPHDLVRDFARELAARPGAQPENADAVERSLRWYQRRLARCAATLRPHPGRVPEQPGGGTAFVDAAAALAWGDTEAANLLFLAGSGGHGRLGPTRTLDLINTLFPYLHDRGRVRDLERLTRHAITLARSSGNTAAEGRALGHLASAHYSVGRVRQALLLLDEAVELSEHLSDDVARMRHLGNRAALLRELGRDTDARTTLARCLALRPDTLAPGEEAILLGHQGYVAELTDPRSALSFHLRSRELARQTGSAVIEQVALCNTGRTHLALGEPAQALRRFDEALRVMASGAAHWNAERETRLGRAQALRELGRLAPAREACGELLEETTARGDSYGRGLAEYEYGHVLRALGNEQEALTRWNSALSALDGTNAQVLTDLRTLTATATTTADS